MPRDFQKKNGRGKEKSKPALPSKAKKKKKKKDSPKKRGEKKKGGGGIESKETKGADRSHLSSHKENILSHSLPKKGRGGNQGGGFP